MSKLGARVRIQVIKVYEVDVAVKDTDDIEADAVSKAYTLSTLEIAERGELITVETDHAEFIEVL